MTLFISNENQNLLYEMIHKTNDIHIVFPPGSQVHEKNTWFRTFIENVYQQLPQNINREELKLINRQVLATMLNSLREIIKQKSVVIETTPQVNPTDPPKYNTLKREHAPEYESKEAQYRSLFDVPKPQVIDFSEKIEDDVITNMDELIEQQKKMRERELQEYAPTLPFQNNENIKVNILEDVPKDAIQPTVLQEKHVSFSIPSDKTKDYDELKMKMEEMDKKLNDILKMMNRWMNPEQLVENNIQKIKEIMKKEEDI